MKKLKNTISKQKLKMKTQQITVDRINERKKKIFNILVNLETMLFLYKYLIKIF